LKKESIFRLVLNYR